MKIEIPAGMWGRFADDVEGNMFCPLCNMPVYKGHGGHEEDCPLYVAEQPEVSEGGRSDTHD